MVPAMIPLLLMLILSMLTALSVVREKELGSIVNLYVTPVSRLEFLLGKQVPYIVLGMLNFVLLVLFAVFIFKVPLTGSFITLTFAALLYVFCATSLGLLISAFTRSQIAALFGTALLTLIPAVQFSGMIDPVSSMQGLGRWIGEVYPATHFLDDYPRCIFQRPVLFGFTLRIYCVIYSCPGLNADRRYVVEKAGTISGLQQYPATGCQRTPQLVT